MSELSSWEMLYLLHLIGRRGSAKWMDRPVPSITAAHRRALERRGLIEVNKGSKGAIVAEVTETGWAWAAGHLDCALPRSKGATPVLMDWMSVIAGHLSAHRFGLGDLFVAASEPVPPPSSARDATEIFARIRERYLAHTSGHWRSEVRLSELKAGFSADELCAVDDALIALAKRGAAELLPIDDPSRIAPRDESAAVRVAGEPRHLIFLHPDPG